MMMEKGTTGNTRSSTTSFQPHMTVATPQMLNLQCAGLICSEEGPSAWLMMEKATTGNTKPQPKPASIHIDRPHRQRGGVQRVVDDGEGHHRRHLCYPEHPNNPQSTPASLTGSKEPSS